MDRTRCSVRSAFAAAGCGGSALVDRPMTLRAKALRYGYKESAETRTTFTTR
jgi:hypothetical protein